MWQHLEDRRFRVHQRRDVRDSYINVIWKRHAWLSCTWTCERTLNFHPKSRYMGIGLHSSWACVLQKSIRLRLSSSWSRSILSAISIDKRATIFSWWQCVHPVVDNYIKLPGYILFKSTIGERAVSDIQQPNISRILNKRWANKIGWLHCRRYPCRTVSFIFQ